MKAFTLHFGMTLYNLMNLIFLIKSVFYILMHQVTIPEV